MTANVFDNGHSEFVLTHDKDTLLNGNSNHGKELLLNGNSAHFNNTTNGTAELKLAQPVNSGLSEEEKLAKIQNAVTTILECIGEEPQRDGLKKTPSRFAKAILSLTEGYHQTEEEVVGSASFDESHHEMVLVRDIDIFSLCEHHLLPFFGKCHIAYIPSGSVIGLSKIARISDMFARRLQVQERLSRQIAEALERATGAKGVMVYVSCAHMCMSMRGVQKPTATTVTTATRGAFRDDAVLRKEFLDSIRGQH